MNTNISVSRITKALTEYHLVYRTFFKGLAKSNTMPLTQYHILTLLSEHENMRMGEISSIMSISRPNLTPLIDRLVLLNYVERISSAIDRRVTCVALTSSGKKALALERSAVSKNIDLFCQKMTSDELEAFQKAMHTLSLIAAKL